MAARRKRAPEPEPEVVALHEALDEQYERDAAASALPPRVILRCEQEGGAVSEIETTMATLTGEGVELPNYVRRVTLVMA